MCREKTIPDMMYNTPLEEDIREEVIKEMGISSIMTVSEKTLHTKYIVRYEDGETVISDNINEIENRIRGKQRMYKLNDLLK
jgi:hypothetical protein